MLMPNRHYPHLTYQVMNDVAQLIDNHLRDDWAIRIEYTDEVKYINTRWKQWGITFFKIKAPDDVIDNIFECHRSNQLCSIRLHAEKYNPESNLYFPVCQACHDSKELSHSEHNRLKIVSASSNKNNHHI